MKLKFHARGDAKVTVPGIRPLIGAPPRYVGRGFVPRAGDTPAQHPAQKEPFEVELDSAAGRRLMKVCRRDQTLWPADRETAAACGVPFVTVSFSDGEWAASAAPAPAKPSSKKSAADSKE